MQLDPDMESLPPELGEKAIRIVDLKDLCNLMLASSKMKTLASNPKFWSGMTVKKQKIKK